MKNLVLTFLIIFLNFPFAFSNEKVSEGIIADNGYIDNSLMDKPILSDALTNQTADNSFHLFSHGQAGMLLINGDWLSGDDLAAFIQPLLQDKSQLNIYGCHFAQGEKGRAAVTYLETALGISVAASDDLTGIDGDWDLEVGKAKQLIQLSEYAYNLQDCSQLGYTCSKPTTSTSNDGSITVTGITTAFPGANFLRVDYKSDECGIPWTTVIPWTSDLSNNIITGLDDCSYTISIYVDDNTNGNGTDCVDIQHTINLKNYTLSVSSNSPVCAAKRLALNAFVPDMEATFSWTGPSGFTSTEMNPELTGFTSSMAGTYSVTMTDPCGQTQTGQVTVAEDMNCNTTCSCNEYVYVNDYLNNITHKFEMNPDGTMIEIGSPWLPYNGSQINSPHGVSIDPNGNLYIAELGESNYVQLDCDGNITNMQAEARDGFNHIIIDNYMYMVVGDFVEVFNLCDGSTSLVGFIQLGDTDETTSTSSWGITYNENDGLIYVTDNYPGSSAAQFASGDGDIYAIDPSDPEVAGSVWQLNSTINPIISGLDRLMGITFDANNNMYFVEQTAHNSNSTIHKYSFDGTNWVPVSSVSDNTNDLSGFYNAWGITWSSTNNDLLVTSFYEDCVAQIDAVTMTYTGAAVPHVPGANAKAINIISECCYGGASAINTTVCEGDITLLRDLLGCDVCGGSWSRTSGTGGNFDVCALTFTADGSTTSSSFAFTADNDQCGPTNVTINITVGQPEAGTASPLTICEGETNVVTLADQLTGEDTGGAWSADVANPSGGVFNAAEGTFDPTGTSTGTFNFTYSFAATDNCVADDATVMVTVNPIDSVMICDNGSTSATLTAQSGLTGVEWFNSSDVSVGTGDAVTIDANTAGMDDGNDSFYYTAQDGSGCAIGLCCPIVVQTESCCSSIDSLLSDRIICSDDLIDSLAVTTTFTNPDSIAFVYFTSQQTDSIQIYTTGTGIDTVQIASANDTVAITNVAFPANTGTSPVVYYVYAIAQPTPSAITCRPYEEIMVTVNPLSTGTVSYAGCQGDGHSVTVNSVIYNESNPTGSQTLNNQYGCDSTVTINLVFQDTIQSPISQDICQGDSHTFNGQTLTIAGTYRDTLTRTNGCDSFIVLTLNVLDVPNITTTDTVKICATQTVDLISHVTDASGYAGNIAYYPSLAAANAQSTVVDTLSVSPSATTTYYVRKNGPVADSTVVINEVEYSSTDQIELMNYGDTTVNIADYWFCSLFSYAQLNTLTIVSGDLDLAPGERVVLSGFALNDAAADLGLFNTNTFASATAMEDFIQWGSAGNGRESVADTKGIWTAGDFIPTVNTSGNSIEYDGCGNHSTDWIETANSLGNYNANSAVNSCAAIDSIVVFIQDCDWGDLPDTSATTNASDYQTISANNGPVHVIIPGLSLGSSVDDETDGQSSMDALGDGVDEDGIIIFPSLDISPGSTFRLPLSYTNTTATAGQIEAWIDWNGDGDFDDTGEKVFDVSDAPNQSTYDRIEVTAPANAVTGQFLGLRIRISHQDNMTPYGLVSEGEIEDYLIGLDCPMQICVPITTTVIRK